MEINKLYLGDCLEVMSEIEDHSIDCILCDLPYEITANQWDTIIPFEPLWQHYKRVIKANGAALYPVRYGWHVWGNEVKSGIDLF